MPQVIVKAWPGKTEEQKQRLASATNRNVTDTIGYGEESVSVGFEEIPSDRWRDDRLDIEEWHEAQYKKPGYRM
jgi:4-oxalocrotonate tautomerase